MNLSKTFPKMTNNDWRKLQLSTDAKNQRDWASRQLHDMENDPDNFTLRDYLKVKAGYKKAAKNIIKNIGKTGNTVWIDEFISEEENKVGTVEYNKYGPHKTLRQVTDKAKGKSVHTGTPISLDEILKEQDLEELLQANPQMQRTD